ncbi:glycoside hydrolase [Flagelloscypha sp. PMI_526]|nr:glycoside hydrolase [Flagelloscypha sp. PMI_526]
MMLGIFVISFAFVLSTSSASLLSTPSLDTRPQLARANSDCFVQPYDAPVLDQTFPPFDNDLAQVYRYRRQHSVNLGSWFVNENWMTPSLFVCAAGAKLSEIDIANGWGSTQASKALLERHWDEFITQDDFFYLASIGINTVRLPVGFWHLGPQFCADSIYANVSPVYEKAWSRIVHAINMASTAGIGVLVDLHGAAGSQNGQPHSGVSDGITGLFKSEVNIEKTLSALTFLLQQLKSVTNIVGIQILNEPAYDWSLETFYGRALDTMRQISLDMPLYVHNGFDYNRFRPFMVSRKDFVVEDHHSYFVFGASDSGKPASEHTQNINTTISHQLVSGLSGINAIVGEWSCALTPQSLSMEVNPEESRRQFCLAQLTLYDNTTAGWHFWSYTKEDCEHDPGWCFKAAVGRSLPSSFFVYPQQRHAIVTLDSFTSRLDTLSSLSATAYDDSQKTFESRQDRFFFVWSRQVDGSPEFTRGYANGFNVAKRFAKFNCSKLGFVDQFIKDHATPPSDDWDRYVAGFKQGLWDAEEAIGMLLSK